MKKIITAFILFLLVLFSNAQNTNKWIEDLDYYKNSLEERHINLYHTISKSNFISEIETLKSRLPRLTDFQIIVELMRITQKIGGGKGDGHTAIPLWNRKLHKYPIQLFNFDGEIRVIGIDENQSQLLGSKLKSVNGISIDTIYKKVSKLTPFTENKQSSMDRTCSYLMIAEILKALNIIENINVTTFTLVDNDNNIVTINLKPFDEEVLKTINYKTLSIQNTIINRPEDAKLKNLWFTSLNNSKTVYINFKEYPTVEEMNAFSEYVFNFIEKNKSKHLIIDLRNNYGGDFYKGLLLASWLNASDSIDWLSNSYVLINRKTYSAAMVNAVQFKQLLNVKIIGEPSGANPNDYQDMGQFTLPNSKLLVTYSKRLFRLQNNNGLHPDVLIEPKWKNYKNGFDEVLSWILNDLENIE